MSNVAEICFCVFLDGPWKRKTGREPTDMPSIDSSRKVSFILFGILRLSRNERGHHLLAQPARTWARFLTPTDTGIFPTFYTGKKKLGFLWKTDYQYKQPSR